MGQLKRQKKKKNDQKQINTQQAQNYIYKKN